MFGYLQIHITAINPPINMFLGGRLPLEVWQVLHLSCETPQRRQGYEPVNKRAIVTLTTVHTNSKTTPQMLQNPEVVIFVGILVILNGVSPLSLPWRSSSGCHIWGVWGRRRCGSCRPGVAAWTWWSPGQTLPPPRWADVCSDPRRASPVCKKMWHSLKGKQDGRDEKKQKKQDQR